MWYEGQDVVYSEEREGNVSRQDRQDRQGRKRKNLKTKFVSFFLGDLGGLGERYSYSPFLFRKQRINNTL